MCRAPEIYEEQPYSFKSDVWALGCVMYEMLTGKPAFAAENLSRVVIRVSCAHTPAVCVQPTSKIANIQHHRIIAKHHILIA